jgi:hypothetical protein
MPDQEITNELLYDKKWHLLIKRAGIFKQIPFIDFVFGSGSLAIGNVDEESDFDVLIGVREGRIFTVRFLSALFLSVLGWRRAKEHGGKSAANKICLNHFVTKPAYRLRLPINSYWKILYERLVPIYGNPEAMQEFFDANSSWLGEIAVETSDLRYQGFSKSWVSRFFEVVLRGRTGDLFEKLLKRYQVGRIEKGMVGERKTTPHNIKVSGGNTTEKIELAPLIVYNDEELEFHPDKAMIEIE